MNANSVTSIVAWVMEQGKADRTPHTQGTQVYRLFCPSDRYIVDNADDFISTGWLILHEYNKKKGQSRD